MKTGDPHTLRAAEYFGCHSDEVTRKQRRVGRSLNHFALYGCSGKMGVESTSRVAVPDTKKSAGET